MVDGFVNAWGHAYGERIALFGQGLDGLEHTSEVVVNLLYSAAREERDDACVLIEVEQAEEFLEFHRALLLVLFHFVKCRVAHITDGVVVPAFVVVHLKG